MPWLRPRLRAVNATASGLARHLDLPPVRVYEMINGQRKLQPGEIAKTASFLKIDEEQLLKLIAGQIDAKDVCIDHVLALPWAVTGDTSAPLLRATLSSHGRWLLHAKGEKGTVTRPTLIRFSSTVFAVVVQDEFNSPVYRARDRILIDPELAVSPGDDVILSSATKIVTGETLQVIPGRLVKVSEATWFLKQYAIGSERSYSRKHFPSAWKIVSRFMQV